MKWITFGGLLYSISGLIYADLSLIELDEITVNASDGSSYFNDSANSASRTAQSIFTTPYSIGKVEQSLIQDSASYRLEDIAQMMSGVQPSSSDSGFSSDVFIRGFTTAGSAYLDGVLDNQRFQVRDLALVDRVEVLKGHSSVLYGSGSPGGTINYITKKPLEEAHHQLSYASGSYDFNRATLDSTGPLNANKSLLYRIIATGQFSNTFRENVRNDRATIAPSLTWHYSQTGSLHTSFEYGYQNQPYLFDNVYTQDKVIYDQSYVDPRAHSDRHYWRFSSSLEQKLTTDWTFKFASNYFHVERDDLLFGFYTLLSPTQLTGYYRDVNDHYDQYSFRTELLGTFDWLGQHNWISGIEHNVQDGRMHSQRRIGGFRLDVFSPDFNHPIPTTSRLDSLTDKKEYGFYSNDQIDINPYWHISGGFRYGLFSSDAINNDVFIPQTRLSATTFSAGTSWTPTERIAFYYGFSQSFQPNPGTDHNLNYLPAKRGTLHELGIKSQWLDRKLGITTALYQIQQSNLPGRDPVDSDYNVAIGQVKSQGLELDLNGAVTDNLQLNANYSWIAAKFDSGSDLMGNTFRSTPRHSGNIWARYQLPLQIPGKLSLGSGWFLVGKRYGDDINSFTVPGYVRTDVFAHYQLNQLDLRLKVENLFDQRYVSSSIYNDTVTQGNRLLMQFLVGIHF